MKQVKQLNMVGKKLLGKFFFFIKYKDIKSRHFADGLNLKKMLKVVVDGVNLMLLLYPYIHYLNYEILFLKEVLYLICMLSNYLLLLVNN
jgi:hypothetical protein